MTLRRGGHPNRKSLEPSSWCPVSLPKAERLLCLQGPDRDPEPSLGPWSGLKLPPVGGGVGGSVAALFLPLPPAGAPERSCQFLLRLFHLIKAPAPVQTESQGSPSFPRGTEPWAPGRCRASLPAGPLPVAWPGPGGDRGEGPFKADCSSVVPSVAISLWQLQPRPYPGSAGP